MVERRRRDADSLAFSTIGGRELLTNTRSWSRLYVNLAILALGLCLPAIWVWAGYWNLSFNASLSFLVDDGWCVKGVQSLASHCFGDYAALDDGLAAGSLWDPSLPTATPYPPIALLPGVLSVRFGELVGSWKAGRDLFLLLLAASLLTPACWVARGRWARRGPIALVVLGVAAAPFLIVLDRGNSVGLVVAPLLGVALAYVRADYRKMVGFITICTLLKPQLILLVLLFLVYRRYSYALATVALSVAATVAGFVFFSGSLIDNLSNWITVITRYSKYQPIDVTYPYNLGIGKTLLTMLDLSHVLPLLGASGGRAAIVDWLQLHNNVPVLVMLVLLVAALLLRKPGSNLIYPFLAVCALTILTPGVSYSYYVALMLVPAALLLRDPVRIAPSVSTAGDWFGMLDRLKGSATRSEMIVGVAVVVGLVSLLVPLVVPVPPFLLSLPAPPAGDILIGFLQVLYGPILLFLLILSLMMTVGRLSPKEIKSRLVDNSAAGER